MIDIMMRGGEREREIFNVSRCYEMLVQILHIERGEKIEDLPYNEIGISGAADDDDDIVTYQVVTNNPKGCLLYTSRCV